jgi:hypothetical protein
MCTQDVFQLQPQNFQEDLLADSVVLAGPGNVKKRTKRQSTSIQWQVGRLVSSFKVYVFHSEVFIQHIG